MTPDASTSTGAQPPFSPPSPFPVSQDKGTAATDSDCLQEKLQEWHRKDVQLLESLRVSVQEKPLTSLAAALAMGALVALLTRPGR